MFRYEFTILGRWKITGSLYRAHPVDGVNSEIEGGGHILMWDFDGVSLVDVRGALKLAQSYYELPRIFILESSPGSYHAYCFVRSTWGEACAIVAQTPGVDKVFLSIAILRGYFTLRFSDKRKGKLRPVGELDSDVPEQVDPKIDLGSFTLYHTRKG